MCTRPIHIANQGIDVPCGHCVDCVHHIQNDYVLRTFYESKRWQNGWFFTLTYRDDNVPQVVRDIYDFDTGEIFEEDKVLNVVLSRDITLWKKRFRRSQEYKTGSVPRFSFLICGEYGPRTSRPHFHGIIFGLERKEFQALMHDWQVNHGFVKWSALRYDHLSAASRYVSKYICKSDDFEDKFVVAGYKPRPRKLVSPNFGFPRLKDLYNGKSENEEFRRMYEYHNLYEFFRDDIPSRQDLFTKVPLAVQRLRMKYEGFSYSLPRYYRKKFFYQTGCTGRPEKNELYSLAISFIKCRHDALLFEQCESYYLQQPDLPPDYASPLDFLSLVLQDEELSRLSDEDVKRCKDKKFYAQSVF